MVKVNDKPTKSISESYINTTIDQGSNTPQNQVAVETNAVNTAKSETNLVLQQLQNVQNDSSRAAARAEEARFQEKSVLSQLDDGIRSAGLKALDTIVEINLIEKTKNDEKVAQSFMLKNQVAAELEFQKFYQEAQKNSGKYGEKLQDNVQKWVNNTLLKLEESAPNETAKGMLQSFGANFKLKKMGAAIEDSANLRNASIKQDVDDTITASAFEAYNSAGTPEGLQAASNSLAKINPFLDSLGLSPEVKNNYLKAAQEKITLATIDGLVDKNQIDVAEVMLGNKNIQKNLSFESYSSAITSISKIKDKLAENSIKEGRKAETKTYYEAKQANGFEPKEMKDIGSQLFLEKQAVIESQLAQTNDLQAFVNNTIEHLDGNLKADLPAYKEYFRSGLYHENPAKQIATATIINRLAEKQHGGFFLSTLNEKDVAKAAILERMSTVTEPTLAVQRADQIINEPDADFLSEKLTKYKEANYITFDKDFVSTKLGLPSDISSLGAAADLNDYFTDYYTLFKGDGELAMEKAVQIVSKQFAESSFNAKASILGTDKSETTLGERTERYPLELFYSPDEMKQVESTIEERLKKSFGNVDMNKRQIKIGDKLIPFKVISKEGYTEFGSIDKRDWVVVNAQPGNEKQMLDVITLGRGALYQKYLDDKAADKKALTAIKAQNKVKQDKMIAAYHKAGGK